MALIALCPYCTEENNGLEHLKETLKVLAETVDLTKHRLFIADNGSDTETVDFLIEWYGVHPCMLTRHIANIGTEAVNKIFRKRVPGEVCINCDSGFSLDLTGVLESMDERILAHPNIGILHYYPDIGSGFVAYNPKMLDKTEVLTRESGLDEYTVMAYLEKSGFISSFFYKY